MQAYIGSILLDAFTTHSELQHVPLKDRLLNHRLREIKLKQSKHGKDRFYLTKRGRDVREDHVRRIMQQLTGHRCWSCRPSWLLSEKGRRLELDIYCPELNVAVEVQGEIHYKFCSFYHRTYDTFLKAKKSDMLKAELCRRRGVKLILIPYTVPSHELEVFIIRELQKQAVL